MGLPWVRLETGFPHNPKIIALAADRRWQAITLYVSGLAYSGEHGTDGFIPHHCLSFIHGTPRVADQLVQVSLWRPRPGGWDINGWEEFQFSSAEHKARSDRARAAAEIRWRGRRRKDAG